VRVHLLLFPHEHKKKSMIVDTVPIQRLQIVSLNNTGTSVISGFIKVTIMFKLES
jgi:hypothetical protein